MDETKRNALVRWIEASKRAPGWLDGYGLGQAYIDSRQRGGKGYKARQDYVRLDHETVKIAPEFAGKRWRDVAAEIGMEVEMDDANSKPEPLKLRKLGVLMDVMGCHLSEWRPTSVEDAQKYLQVGPQRAKDTLERLAERGIALRKGSMAFVQGPNWQAYARANNWLPTDT